MEKSFKRGLLAILAFAGTLGAGMAAESLPNAESFFQNRHFGHAELSPNGRLVAFTIGNKDSRARLAVLDLQTMKAEVAASFSGADVSTFRWINDRRLVFNLADHQAAKGDIDAAPGLFAVNADGSSFRQLVERRRSFLKAAHEQELLPWNTYLLDSVGRQDSDDVLVVKPERITEKEVDYIKLQRLNTLTGRVTEVDAPLHSFGWILDRNGELRVALTREKNQEAIHVRDPASGLWTKLAEFEQLSDRQMKPRYIDSAGRLFVETRNARNTWAIHTYDLSTRKLSDEPFLASEKYDLAPTFVATQEKLLGMRYFVDAEVTQWFDAEMQTLQAGVDRLLPASVNNISLAARAETKFVLVNAYADTLPGVYYLYNTQERKLIKLGSVNPDMEPRKMSLMTPVRYPARDGLEIPAYLTVPRGAEKKNLPLVVLVHGGPYMRGEHWGWNPEVQFLASRGYAVLQPEFRGSTGFGARHFESGWKQWGLAMQNDIADGVQWAVAQGIADPKRVCIAGASYGGYAVLMGLANDPALYRCGIDWVGVTDINLLYTVGWSDTSDTYKQYGMPKLIGDPVKDAAQFKATSPLENAAKIRAPLLMAYGGQDRRVPIIHGEKFRDAVKAHNPNVEWIVYDREGHGWGNPATRAEFWNRVERFLEANIGKP